MGDLVLYGGQLGTNNALALVNSNKTPEEVVAEQEKRIEEANKLEEKLKIINEQVPTRVYNTCSSSAGAGSSDFHQYRMIRKAEQERQRRLDEAFQKQKEQEEFEAKRREREQQAEERTSKKRAKRLKKKAKKKAKPGAQGQAAASGASEPTESGSEEEDQPEQAELD